MTPWKFGTTPDQCFNCQKFGHSKEKCKEKTICLRCSGNHHFKACPIKDPAKFKCANCGGNHAACSKSCNILQEAVKSKTLEQEKKATKKVLNNTKHQVSQPTKNSHQSQNIPTLSILKLIIDLIKNLNKITSSVHEDPRPILDIISSNLGPQYSRELEPILFESLKNDHQDSDMLDPYVNNEYEQE